MFKFKNAISPVIAVILLLAITVVISMSMYSFLQDYTENNTSSLSSSNFNSVKVIGVYNDKLFLDSEESELFSLFQIKDLNGNIQCEIRDSVQSTFQGDTQLLMTFDSDTVNSTHVKDLSGYNNHGSINGSTYTEENCILGGCFEFIDDNSYDRIEVNWNNRTNLNKDSSYSIWINNFDISNANADTIFRDGLVLDLNSHLFISSSGTLTYSWYNGTMFKDESIINLTSNTNYFLVLSFDLNSNINVFIDSILIKSFSPDLTDYNNGSQLNLGSTFPGTTNQNFNGTIDEFAIYSKYLTQEEVSKLYELKSAKFYEQLLSTQTKEINLLNCNLNKNEKYDFIGILESGTKINEKITIN